MKILEKILERLVICWHVLTKRNYAFFALDNDAIVFDSNGNYSHIDTNKVTEFDYFDEDFNLGSKHGIKNIGWFIWSSIAYFAHQRIIKEVTMSEQINKRNK
jgi:hypothetical protein